MESHTNYYLFVSGVLILAVLLIIKKGKGWWHGIAHWYATHALWDTAHTYVSQHSILFSNAGITAAVAGAFTWVQGQVTSLQHHSGLWTLAAIFTVFIGSALLRTRTSKTAPSTEEIVQPVQPPQPPPEPQSPIKITQPMPAAEVIIDITRGIVAQVGANVRILLRVQVRNRSVPDLTANDWSLNLLHEGDHWKFAYKNPLPDDLTYQVKKPTTEIGVLVNSDQYDDPKTITKDLDDLMKNTPLDPLTLQNGWLMFHLSHALIEQAFSATYELTLIEKLRHEYRGRREPGGWLEPAKLSRTGGGNL